ncbi:hypothetical protein MOSE0_K06150 [Monosporozyma servazzii]
MSSEYYFQRDKNYSEKNCPIVKRVAPRNKKIPTFPPETGLRRYTTANVSNGYIKSVDKSNLYNGNKRDESSEKFRFSSPKDKKYTYYPNNDIKNMLNSIKDHVEPEIPKITTTSRFLADFTRDIPPSGIPVNFNPRLVANMRHKEKVNLWIQMVPVLQIENPFLRSDCYQEHFSLYWEEFEFEGGFNEESYIKAESDVIPVIDKDYQLFIQEQKYGLLVRKLYTLEEY